MKRCQFRQCGPREARCINPGCGRVVEIPDNLPLLDDWPGKIHASCPQPGRNGVAVESLPERLRDEVAAMRGPKREPPEPITTRVLALIEAQIDAALIPGWDEYGGRAAVEARLERCLACSHRTSAGCGLTQAVCKQGELMRQGALIDCGHFLAATDRPA